ncbi:carbohydrate ABC transporter permease [Spongiactinospora gelatinilytica]|uniref:carbohydrate ABC transporter permease n=1 Tax=Spongiactinospora gelatinilytica TaxID=2666298 RepID=UPI0011B93BAC|nr:sugar ABC transporter permease [Spongiactinospora gelatinilytica]
MKPSRARAGRPSVPPVAYAFVLPAVLFMVATVLYPLAFTVDLSFRDVGLREIVAGGGEFAGLANYRAELGGAEFRSALWTSMVYTVVSVALSFAAGLALAVFLNHRFPGRGLLRSALLVAWVLPSVVSANIWRWLLDGTYGLLNAALRGLGLLDADVFWLVQPATALASVIVATVWSTAPFAMILLLAGLQSIPGPVHEAATIDGAGPWQRFSRITLPLLRPVSVTVLLLLFVTTFKTFDTIYLMTRGGPGDATTILPIHAYLEAFSFFRFGTGAAATTIMLLIPLALSLFYFRALRREEVA